MKMLYVGGKSHNGTMDAFHDYMKKHCDYHTYFPADNNFLKTYQKIKPDILFIHHNRRLFSDEMYAHFDKSYNIYWCNDERLPIDKGISSLMGKVNLFLMASDDTVATYRANDADAEYLIMGYQPQEVANFYDREKDVVFTGQNSTMFQLSTVREEYIKGLMRDCPNVEVYGKGWGSGIKSHARHTIYSRTKIGLAINHMNTGRTYSNRMLQIMGKGAMCLALHTKDLQRTFIPGKHIVTFSDYKDMLHKIAYYLKNDNERVEIAKAGYKLVSEHFSWEAKAKRIINLLKSTKRKLLPN